MIIPVALAVALVMCSLGWSRRQCTSMKSRCGGALATSARSGVALSFFPPSHTVLTMVSNWNCSIYHFQFPGVPPWSFSRTTVRTLATPDARRWCCARVWARGVWSTVHSTHRTGRSTSATKSAEPKAAEKGRHMELQVRKLWSTALSTHRTGWSTFAAGSAEPKAAERGRRMELQVQKLRNAVHSTHRTGWSTSATKSAEPKAVARSRRLVWSTQEQRSIVHSTPD